MKYDIIVIGAGPGGYVAAIRAAQLGFSVAIVEKSELGGTCLNWGCIPMKALLESSHLYGCVKHGEDYGLLQTDKVKFCIDTVVKKSREIASKLSFGVAGLLKKNKIALHIGTAKIGKKEGEYRSIEIEKEKIYGQHIIIATGAQARSLKGMENRRLFWTYREALVAPRIPQSILIIGSGAIGLEFASFFQEAGSKVTILEKCDRILPSADSEISSELKKILEKKGIEFYINHSIKEWKESGKYGVEVLLESSEQKTKTQNFEQVIVAVGVTAQTESLGLDQTLIKTHEGFITVNDHFETSESGIYAIGDVIGMPCLAHKASHDGILCVEAIKKQKNNGVHKTKNTHIPACIYTSPQVASLGLTEQEAIKMYGKENCKIGRFPFSANGKALTHRKSDGFIKVIFHSTTGEFLGVHMIGPEVTELLATYSIAQTLETTEEEFMRTIFAHPTLSEVIHEATLNAFGRSIHI